jgi:hypothetical protein
MSIQSLAIISTPLRLRALASLLALSPFTPAQVQLIASSDFEAGMQGWTEDRPTRGDVQWISSGGNPGGYLEFNDSGSGSSSWIVAPQTYLGNWSRLNGAGILLFDQRVIVHSGCATFPYAVDLADGSGNYAIWRGALAARDFTWRRVAVPLDPALWSVTGSWTSLLANVTRLRIGVELVNNNSGCGSGRELTGTDSISLWSATPAMWRNYGQGWPGSLGVPRISLDRLPPHRVHGHRERRQLVRHDDERLGPDGHHTHRTADFARRHAPRRAPAGPAAGASTQSGPRPH